MVALPDLAGANMKSEVIIQKAHRFGYDHAVRNCGVRMVEVETREDLERAINPAWWLTLISGILMTILAFWTSGQLFIHKAYVLLVFAGIWALMEGTVDIVRAFEIRQTHKEL